MSFDIGKAKDMQRQISAQAVLETELTLADVRYIAGFDVAYVGDTCYCAAVVFDITTMEIIERKTLTSKAPMNYIPGLLAFREGPLICQLYFDLETEPDVIMIDGHGVSDPGGCGTAVFVGVELGKPTIGVARNLVDAEVEGDMIVMNGHVVGRAVRTKQHARELFVSSGNLITHDLAAELVLKTVVPPHKLPEPLHAAARLADKSTKKKELIAQ